MGKDERRCEDYMKNKREEKNKYVGEEERHRKKCKGR